MQITEAAGRRHTISLTPLIDIIFILLVFFMLASSFLKWQFFELGVSEAESIPVNLDRHSLIRVDLDRQYFLNGDSLPLADIAGIVRERLRQDPEHPVLVQPVNDLPLQDLVHVLDRLKHLAGADVSLTREPDTL